MTILEFTDIELEIEDLEARAKGLDEDEGADVLGGYNRAAMARGRANRRRKRRCAHKVLVEEVAKDEDHVGVKVEERRYSAKRSLSQKRVSMREARYYAVGCKFDLKIFACLSKSI